MFFTYHNLFHILIMIFEVRVLDTITLSYYNL